MCSTHGKLIDTDEARFTTPLLKQWRQLAERRAELSLHGSHFDVQEHDLLTHKVTVSAANLNESTIGNAFIDAAVPIFWGERISEAVRDFVFEITQNALTHGGAEGVCIEFSSKRITTVDSGKEFNPKHLLSFEHGQGGAAAYKALQDVVGDQLMISTSRKDYRNSCEVRFIRTQSDLTEETPCHLNFEHDLDSGKGITDEALASVANCEVVYVVLPDFMSFSKARRFQEHGLLSTLAGKQVVFVGNEISISVKDLLLSVKGSRFLALGGQPGRLWIDP
jgi:hypothetical protein